MQRVETFKIWEYPLNLKPQQLLMMPKDAELLCVHKQLGEVVLCAKVDPRAEMWPRVFVTIGTGHEFGTSKPHHYVGTAHVRGFVWHVFEIEGEVTEFKIKLEPKGEVG